MTPDTKIKNETTPQPWVKPVVERIPLSAAQNGASAKADDGTVGSS